MRLGAVCRSLLLPHTQTPPPRDDPHCWGPPLANIPVTLIMWEHSYQKCDHSILHNAQNLRGGALVASTILLIMENVESRTKNNVLFVKPWEWVIALILRGEHRPSCNWAICNITHYISHAGSPFKKTCPLSLLRDRNSAATSRISKIIQTQHTRFQTKTCSQCRIVITG